MSLSPGTRLGSYEILSLLGEGGMGQVFRARDTTLDRDVAIKILPESFAQDPERVARFRREAQLLAALNHPHIGAIYGLDTANGVQFLVLELVEGETLADKLAPLRARRSGLPLDEALAIAQQIAEALKAAHDQGIVHRDLKPANIALTSEGRVKVLDFGLAKAMDPVGRSFSSGDDAGPKGPAYNASVSPTMTSPVMLSSVGMILGTAAYMSPEQAKGRVADKRSDVWAFGCVLYEMLTGRRPFDPAMDAPAGSAQSDAANDVGEVLAAVIRGEVNWAALPANVPEPLRRVLARCLEKDPRKRVSDIAVVSYVLEQPDLMIAPRAATAPATTRVSPLLLGGGAVRLLGRGDELCRRVRRRRHAGIRSFQHRRACAPHGGAGQHGAAGAAHQGDPVLQRRHHARRR